MVLSHMAARNTEASDPYREDACQKRLMKISNSYEKSSHIPAANSAPGS
jgi:hypothetical protein